MKIDQSDTALDALAQIDRICLRFETELKANDSPDLLAAVRTAPPELEAALFRDLLELELEYIDSDTLEQHLALYREALSDNLVGLIDEILENAPGDPFATRVYQSRFGRYHVVRKIGQGGFGSVLEVLSEKDNTRHALKVYAASKEHTQLARTEIRCLRELLHPNIVRLLDVIDNETHIGMVLELANGGTLRDHIKHVPPERLSHWVMQIADAAHYCHTHGVIHRDIEPSNILIDAEERPLLADFGLAIRDNFVSPEPVHELAGSLGYMSPEQSRGDSHWLDARSDVWSLGIVLYEGITKQRPFSALLESDFLQEIQHRPIKPPRQICPEVDAKLEAICMKCLARDPSGRYQTAAELRDALKATLVPPVPQRAWFRSAAATVAIGLAVLGVAAVARRPESQNMRQTNVSKPPTADTSFAALTGRSQNKDAFLIRVHRGSAQYDLHQYGAIPVRNGDEIIIDSYFHKDLPPDWKMHALLFQPDGKPTAEGEFAKSLQFSPTFETRGTALLVILLVHDPSAKTTREWEAILPKLPSMSVPSANAVRFLNLDYLGSWREGDFPQATATIYRTLLAKGVTCHVYGVAFGVQPTNEASVP